MKKTIALLALATGLAHPASAATTTLDFTKDNVVSGSAGGTVYTVTAGPGSLVNSKHKTNAGCTGSGWDFICAGSSGSYDVGFGTSGTNGNEIDGAIASIEWVQVKFDSLVKVLGFAGMLTYNDSQTAGTETVVLQYSADGGSTWSSVAASALDDDNGAGTAGNDLFNTVGLAYLKNLSLIANVVRFTAGGTYPYDDKNTNVTAAGLMVAPVPVPASFPLLLAGLGALGFAARRKRKSA